MGSAHQPRNGIRVAQVRGYNIHLGRQQQMPGTLAAPHWHHHVMMLLAQLPDDVAADEAAATENDDSGHGGSLE
jgi:hypothetical protein